MIQVGADDGVHMHILTPTHSAGAVFVKCMQISFVDSITVFTCMPVLGVIRLQAFVVPGMLNVSFDIIRTAVFAMVRCLAVSLMLVPFSMTAHSTLLIMLPFISGEISSVIDMFNVVSFDVICTADIAMVRCLAVSRMPGPFNIATHDTHLSMKLIRKPFMFDKMSSVIGMRRVYIPPIILYLLLIKLNAAQPALGGELIFTTATVIPALSAILAAGAAVHMVFRVILVLPVGIVCMRHSCRSALFFGQRLPAGRAGVQV